MNTSRAPHARVRITLAHDLHAAAISLRRFNVASIVRFGKRDQAS